MKTFLIAVLLTAGCTTISPAQKITYKDIIGKWQEYDTSATEAKSELDFVDSNHVILSQGTMQLPAFTYTLDNSKTPTLMQIQISNSQNQVKDMYWLVKLNNGILKTQGDFTGNIPTKWNDNETFNNTGVMKKIQ
jgi:hypothetical protein